AEGEKLVTRWEQLVAQRTGAGGIAAQTPLSSAAVLYFPLESGSGITCEVRQLSFDGQNAQQLVYGLLDALSAGATDAANIPDMPDLRTMLLMAPEVTTLSSGRQSAAINLVPDALQRISSAGIDPVCFFAALTMTLTSYIPSLEQVVYRVGDSALTSLYSTIHGTIVLPGGMMTRANFGGLLTDEAVCYLSNGEKLRQGRLNLPASEACSPRALLTAVLATEGFPAGLAEDDVLGVAIVDDTVLVNFSAHMADAIRASKLNQRMMAYQLTGALVQRYPVRRVRFFFDGEAKNTLDGDVMWAGEFLMDYVLCE
ncbi:MAG TPA: hypothetical protein DEQ37_06745, partial [Clostridiales bacterium]|nr:hypothetical protein [Clostridiales bacterium]